MVKSSHLVYPAIWSDPNLAYHDNTHLFFNLPDEFREDLVSFTKGKYSEMSEEAKQQIRKHSGLNYCEKVKNSDGKWVYRTDSRIRVLTKDLELRLTLEDLLNIELSKDSELISPPSPDEIWVEDKSPA